MPKHNSAALAKNDLLFPGKVRKPIPHEFVLDAIAALSPVTRSMFGCIAVYVAD